MGMEASVEFILENMSARLADQLKEEVTEAGTPKPADTDAAMATIVTVIRDMEKAGELMLVSADEE